MDLETRPVLRKLTTAPGCVPTSQGSNGQHSGELRAVQTVRSVGEKACKMLRAAGNNIFVGIFGRGARRRAHHREGVATPDPQGFSDKSDGRCYLCSKSEKTSRQEEGEGVGFGQLNEQRILHEFMQKSW